MRSEIHEKMRRVHNRTKRRRSSIEYRSFGGGGSFEVANTSILPRSQFNFQLDRKYIGYQSRIEVVDFEVFQATNKNPPTSVALEIFQEFFSWHSLSAGFLLFCFHFFRFSILFRSLPLLAFTQNSICSVCVRTHSLPLNRFLSFVHVVNGAHLTLKKFSYFDRISFDFGRWQNTPSETQRKSEKFQENSSGNQTNSKKKKKQ